MYTSITESTEMFKKFNSMTKYPSILTYHSLGDRGSLVDSLVEEKSFSDEKVFITEKVDGTNSRLILFTDRSGYIIDYLIGSREDILYAMGDRIINPSQGIVVQLKKVADMLITNNVSLFKDSVICLYGETFGGNINGFKQYTSRSEFSIRFFDMWHMPLNDVFDNILLSLSVEEISSWRKNDGQPFVSVDELRSFCSRFNLNMVPYISIVNGLSIPNSLQGTWNWMQQFKNSVATLDEKAVGFSEGVVLRTNTRSLIRKLRFEDYAKTKRRGLIHD